VGQNRRKFGTRRLDGARDAEIRQLRDGESGVSARIDVRERRQIHRDIHRQAMVGAAVAHAQTQRGDFRFAVSGHDIDARRRDLAIGNYPDVGEPFYHRRLDAPDHVADAEPRSPKVEKGIGDELPGTVVGDLSAAIHLDRRDAIVPQQMFNASGESERIDRRMLGQPDFIG